MRFSALSRSMKNGRALSTRDGRMRLGLSISLALGGLILLAILLAHDAGVQAEAQTVAPFTPALSRALPPATGNAGLYPNCRFGAGQVSKPIDSYDTTAINLGWYLSWGTLLNPPRPGGVEYAQMLRVSASGYSPSGVTLTARIAANPGSLWLIGNEPDCIYQNNVLPQEYAQVYHDAYTFIKSQDPTARVAAGGIVQPTPLRMQYLDLVLDAYTSYYGEPLPTDVWHIHSFILREASCTVYPDSCWGCEIPPGITADEGMMYSLDDIDRLDIFQARIVQFRQWMRDRGYQDTPLIVTEYGTLLPYYDPDSLYYDSQGNPFDEARASVFMYGTFDYMLTASDPDIGYAPDENHLVQQWLWYSLDDTNNYGGALFEPYTYGIMQLGSDFASYTGAISPTVDLLAVKVEPVGSPPFSPTNPVTVTLRAYVSNVGNVSATQPITVRFLDGEGHTIGSDQIISVGLAGCAWVAEVTVDWPDLTPGAHTVRAIVDPADVVNEDDESNNEAEGFVLIATNRVFLPLIPQDR